MPENKQRSVEQSRNRPRKPTEEKGNASVSPCGGSVGNGSNGRTQVFFFQQKLLLPPLRRNLWQDKIWTQQAVSEFDTLHITNLTLADNPSWRWAFHKVQVIMGQNVDLVKKTPSGT